MRIQYVSDLHLGHWWMYRNTFPKIEAIAPILVIAGDQWASGREFTHSTQWVKTIAAEFDNVIMVLGNHDYYGTEIDATDKAYQEWAAEYKNVHVLQNSSVTIDDVKFIGSTLWTDFVWVNGDARVTRLDDFYKLSDASQILHGDAHIEPAEILRRHKLAVDYIRSNADSTSVVVTHHGPSYKGLSPKYAPKYDGELTINHLFFSDLEQLIEETEPKAWIYGHSHDSAHFYVGSTRVAANPCGYVSGFMSENMEFDAMKTIEV